LVYFPNIESKIIEKNLPIEIKFLSIVESALQPAARSSVGAVGLWQFMKSTARMYGLEIDSHVDERRDVEKSTDAALQYLSDLNERFGDWTLALAAYNCGPGNVRKAMRRSGGKDYWSIRKYLPRETRNYVPKFIAMTYLMNYYSDHDLSPQYPDELFVKTRKLLITEGITFSKVSALTGVPMETIEYYNPSYIGHYVPRSSEGKILELPSQAIYAMAEELNLVGGILPDVMQDLENETKVAAQIIERKELIDIIPLETYFSKLENAELLYIKSNFDISHSRIVNNKLIFAKTRQILPDLNSKEKRRQSRKHLASKVKEAYYLK
jgi:membrane-bound lytic murein transglycosylase D